VKKTKKEKIEARTRREKFLYSLSLIQNASPPKKNFNLSEKTVTLTNQPQISMEGFSYLKADILRISVFAFFAFLIQIVLYLTIF